MKTLLSIISSVVLFFGGLFAPHPLLGSYNPTGGGTYRLQSSIGASDTSLTLTSFKEPISNIPYTMSYLNSSIEYATIEPQTTSSKEFVSFSGITQNADGTATLTGLTRGLGFSYPYTASTTLQQAHPGQAIFILSNPPQLTNQYANKNNTETIANVWTYSSTTPPRYDYVAAQANGTYIATTSELASVAYVNAVALTSAPNGTTAVKGVYQTATGLQAASSTALGSTGAQLVLGNGIATDTPSAPQSVSGSKVIMSDITGYLKHAWLNLADAFTWTGANIFSSTLTANATTTIAASSVTNNALVLNGIAYAFPPTQSASSTVLSTNGSGSLYWTGGPVASYVGNTFSTTTSNSTNGTWSQDTVYTTGFQPTTIVLYLRGNSSHGGTASYVVSTNVFNGTACTGGLVMKPESTVDTMVPSATTVGCALEAGSGSYPTDEALTASIPSVTSTGFTVRITRSQGGSFSGAGMSVSPVAYR